MVSILGAILIALGSFIFWYLMPSEGRVHPFVRKSDVGSMVTIGIMTLLTVGVALLVDGLVG